MCTVNFSLICWLYKAFLIKKATCCFLSFFFVSFLFLSAFNNKVFSPVIYLLSCSHLTFFYFYRTTGIKRIEKMKTKCYNENSPLEICYLLFFTWLTFRANTVSFTEWRCFFPSNTVTFAFTVWPHSYALLTLTVTSTGAACFPYDVTFIILTIMTKRRFQVAFTWNIC